MIRRLLVAVLALGISLGGATPSFAAAKTPTTVKVVKKGKGKKKKGKKGKKGAKKASTIVSNGAV